MTSIEIEIAGLASDFRQFASLDISSPVGDIEDIVKKAGYSFIEQRFGNSFSGFCKPLGQMNYLIGFNKDHNWNRGYRRFTIAHELGHLSIPHHAELLSSPHFSSPEHQSSKRMEREADLFAINFLAPKPAVARSIMSSDFDVIGVEDLAEYFGLSFYSAALRFVETTSLTCFLVVCDSTGVIKYERRSKSLSGTFFHRSIKGNVVDLAEGTDISLADWYPNLSKDVFTSLSVVNLGYNDTVLAFLCPHDSEIEAWSPDNS